MNDNNQNNTMILNGKGQVNTIPDTAIIRLGVQTTGINLTRIQAENTKLINEVLEAIKQLGITDIQTSEYRIERLYDFENGNRIDKGYSLRNIIDIRTLEINQAGNVIDTAVDHGANVVDFISFEISDHDTYYRQALTIAVLDAYQKAKSITDELLGVDVNPIPLKITENSAPPMPYSRFSPSSETALATPIEPGSLVTDAYVTVKFSY